MKKLFVLALLFAGVCGASAQSELTKVGEVEVNSLLCRCPSEFLYEGKAHFLTRTWDSTGDSSTFGIYNSDIELEKTITLTDVTYIYYTNLNTNNSGDEFDSDFYMSQTLFNQDDKWEWVNQIIEDDKYVGFQVMQEGDVELFNLRYEEEFSKNADVALSAWIMDDKVYLAVRSAVQNDLWDVTYSWYFYLIDNSAEKTNIKYVGKVKGLSAMPTIVERSTPVTVEFGDNTEATHEIIVTSASGQVLQRQKVVAGQNSVSLNTSRWSKGLNIVTTKNSDNETESCKIIVK